MNESDITLSYIERKGWQTARTGSGWQVCHPDNGASFFLSFTPSWICLQAPVKTAGSLDDMQRARLLRHLLRRNEEMFMGKFCCDHAGQLTLQVELPTGGSIHRIDYALDALARYLKLYGDEIAAPDERSASLAADRASKELYFDAPPGIPHEVIYYYLRAVQPHGWGARAKPKGITWQLGYKGQRLFEVFLTITKSWTYFHIPALTEAPSVTKGDHLAAQNAFLDYLLRINDTWYMAKLGLSDADRVLMMLEIPTQELDFEMFRQITRLLSAYLDLYAREIQIMSHLPSDPKLVEQIVLTPKK